MDVKIPKASTNEFIDLRKGIARCIEAVSNGVVYSSYVVQYSLDETIEALTKEEGGNKKIHAWLILIDSINVSEAYSGGSMLDFSLNIRLVGFVGYKYGTDNNSRQSLLEKDCKEIIKVIYLNALHLGMEDTTHIVKAKVGTPEFEEIDIKAFGTGYDVLVAEGNMTVTWQEHVIEEI